MTSEGHNITVLVAYAEIVLIAGEHERERHQTHWPCEGTTVHACNLPACQRCPQQIPHIVNNNDKSEEEPTR